MLEEEVKKECVNQLLNTVQQKSQSITDSTISRTEEEQYRENWYYYKY